MLDVAIVGGSLAGLYAGHLLARAGHQVRIFECASRIDPPRRSLIVTAVYRDLLGRLGEDAVVNEIGTFELLADGQRAEVRLQRPDLIIERAELVRSLHRQAVDSGAHVITDRHFRSLRPTHEGLELRFSGNVAPARAAVVIGADGSRSQVAHAAGMPRPPVTPLLQALVRLPDDLPTDRTRVWFVPEDTPYFYWLIPDSETTGALGIIGCNRRETRDLLDRFVAREGLEVLGYQGARIPEYAGWQSVHRPVGAGDVYVVGDAAGHVKVTTVGGVVNGLWGAEGVVDRILGKGGGKLRALRLELSTHLLIRRALHRFDQSDYRRLLGLLDSSSKRCLGRHSRDETVRLMVSLLFRRPRLGILGLRGLLGLGAAPAVSNGSSARSI